MIYMCYNTAIIIIPVNYSSLSLYTSPTVPYEASLSLLVDRQYAQSHHHACLTETNKPKHAVNKIVKLSEGIHICLFKLEQHIYTGTYVRIIDQTTINLNSI